MYKSMRCKTCLNMVLMHMLKNEFLSRCCYICKIILQNKELKNVHKISRCEGKSHADMTLDQRIVKDLTDLMRLARLRLPKN